MKYKKNNAVVVGLQWGDEGKGKIVDLLASSFDIVVRFQGGHNAGHTIVANGKTYKLSLLPSGIIQNKICVIGSGLVIDPEALLNEVRTVSELGIKITSDNLMIADNACLIISLHRELDQASETSAAGDKIGTTGRGIGPAYEDKVARRAIRICDLRDDDTLKHVIAKLVRHHNILRTGHGLATVSDIEIYKEVQQYKERLLSFSVATWRRLNELRNKGMSIIFEGAQGLLLDIDYGTYPFVTSSNTMAPFCLVGSGSGMNNGEKMNVLGVSKAYMTRVGMGPFPTELHDEIGIKLQVRGAEFGTVTGRKRRCGWLDLVLLKQAVQLSGATEIILTKLDVLDDLPEIQFATSYIIDNKEFDYMPTGLAVQNRIVPIYRSIKGWQEDTSALRTGDNLPVQLKKYIEIIEEFCEVKISMISTGPDREQVISLMI